MTSVPAHDPDVPDLTNPRNKPSDCLQEDRYRAVVHPEAPPRGSRHLPSTRQSKPSTSVHLDELHELRVEGVLNVGGGPAVVWLVEQPLLSAAAPGRLEVVPLALVGGAEVQHLPAGGPGQTDYLRVGDHVVT